MKIKYYIYAAILIVVGYLVYSRIFNSSTPSAGPQQARPGGGVPTISVNGIIVTPQEFTERIFITGNIVANEQVDLRPETSGKITQIYFREGSNVSQGQLLIKINDSELQAQLAKAKNRQQLAEQQEFRQRQLLQKEAVSQQDYDVVLAELNSLKTETQLIQAQLQKTEIRAPFSGTIGLRAVSVGDYVTPNSIISKLVSINPAKIEFSIPERYSSLIQNNTKIIFTVVGTDKTFEGTVFAIEPKIDQTTRTIQLKAISPNSNGLLLPGAFARIELSLNKIQNALMVPTQAIIPEATGQKVFIVKDGKALPVTVEIGTRTESQIQITKGINANDTVITTGILQLRPGIGVQINNLKQ